MHGCLFSPKPLPDLLLIGTLWTHSKVIWQGNSSAQDKMTAISQTAFYIFTNEKFCISIKISLKFVPKVPNDNKSALVQVMAWHLTAYMRHSGEIRWLIISHIQLHAGDILTIINSGSCIIWTDTEWIDSMATRPSGTNFNERQMKVQHISFYKMHLKMLSARCCIINNWSYIGSCSNKKLLWNVNANTNNAEIEYISTTQCWHDLSLVTYR